MLKFFSIPRSVFIFCGLFLASYASAATVHHCNPSQKRCIIKLSEGQKDDSVRVIDDGAHLIDTGKIILVKRTKGGKGIYAVIELSKTKKQRREIHRGYPVIVELEHEKSHMIWGTQIRQKR
jgi:hypothetical protein